MLIPDIFENFDGKRRGRGGGSHSKRPLEKGISNAIYRTVGTLTTPAQTKKGCSIAKFFYSLLSEKTEVGVEFWDRGCLALGRTSLCRTFYLVKSKAFTES